MRAKQPDPKPIFSFFTQPEFDVPAYLRTAILPAFQDHFRSIYDIVWLSFALIIGCGLRSYFISQPMRYDESYTFLTFLNGDLQSLLYYPNPNNHVLHSVLAKLVILILGAHPTTIRAIAFLAGLGCIPLIFSLCRELKQSGVFAALAISVFPYLVLYSTNARGYTLLVLLTLLLTCIGLHLVKRPSIAGAILISLVASLGMLTMPSMLFSIAGLYLWVVILLFMNTRDLQTVFYKFMLPAGLFTALFTLILYTPVIVASQGIETIVNNSYVEPQAWSTFFEQLYPHIRSTLSDFLRDVPAGLRLLLALLVSLGIFSYVKKRDHASFLLLPSLMFGSAVIFFLQHKIPFGRTWIFVIPFIIVIADAGFTFILERLSPRMNRYLLVVTFLAAVVFATSLTASNAIARYPDTGAFSEAPIAAKFLETQITKQEPGLVFESKTPATYPIYFYLWYYDVPIEFANDNSAHPDTIYIVQKSTYSLDDMTDQPVNTILAIDDMHVFRGVIAE